MALPSGYHRIHTTTKEPNCTATKPTIRKLVKKWWMRSQGLSVNYCSPCERCGIALENCGRDENPQSSTPDFLGQVSSQCWWRAEQREVLCQGKMHKRLLAIQLKELNMGHAEIEWLLLGHFESARDHKGGTEGMVLHFPGQSGHSTHNHPLT